MALNPLAFTENVVKSFLRYQFTTYAFATVDLMRCEMQLSTEYSFLRQ